MLGLYLLAFSVLGGLVAIALGSVAEAVGVLLLVIGLFAVMCIASRMRANSNKQSIPASVAIYPDRVEATFHDSGSPGSVPQRLNIPFAAVEMISSAGNNDGREHLWVPAVISANPARVGKFQPSSVLATLRAPPAPAGCAQSFTLATHNIEPVRAAYLIAVPSTVVLRDGGLRGPEY
ncbi:MAG: hypothetical protein L3K11_07060 [Thermoplasmata archaeon]|nr:hypothetical protein [Thermoplasmata archaeon]